MSSSVEAVRVEANSINRICIFDRDSRLNYLIDRGADVCFT